MSTPLKKSQRQERDAAAKYGGRVRPGSGNKWHSKGDVITEDSLIEVKYTDKKSFSLKLEELLKIEREALMEDRVPLFGISFSGKNYVVMTEEDYETLMLASEEDK